MPTSVPCAPAAPAVAATSAAARLNARRSEAPIVREPAAVGEENRSCDVTCGIREEEHCGPGHFFRLGPALHRRLVRIGLVPLWLRLDRRRERRFDHSRTDRVHADALLAPL